MASKELLTVNLISIGKPMPDVLNLRNSASIGRRVEVYPQQRFPRYFYIAIWIVMIFGVFFIAREVISVVLQVAALVRAA
jgi:hypothetical protein